MTQQLLRTRYSPHEGQVEVHTLHAKEKWIEAARRWGKSRCALGEMEAAYHESLTRSIDQINRYQLVPPGFHAWVVAPSYVQGRQAWNEMLQMLMLEPKLCILDETDSGLDVDALRIISKSIQSMRDSKRSFIVITHYHRILEHLDADFVHILSKGKIVKTAKDS